MADNKNKPADQHELGFGSQNYQSSIRFLNTDGTVNVQRTGLGGINNIDVYHWLISVSRIKLAAVILAGYISINLIFGTIFYLIGSENFFGINQNSESEKFLNLFFFSAQTITTLGYGHLRPLSNLANIAASFESLLGLISFAIATGIIFGRFSRPKAHLLYSSNLLISPYKSGTALMFRVTNQKQNELIETEASVTMTINNKETNKRDFVNLKLELSRINFLALSWTIVHPIDESSPVHGLTLTDLKERDVEIMILIRAINDTFSQTVFSRYSYKAVEIVDKARFKPLKPEATKFGKIRIAVTEIHNYEIIG